MLVDSSKVVLRPFHAWARLAAAWTFVTDDGDGTLRAREAGTGISNGYAMPHKSDCGFLCDASLGTSEHFENRGSG